MMKLQKREWLEPHTCRHLTLLSQNNSNYAEISGVKKGLFSIHTETKGGTIMKTQKIQQVKRDYRRTLEDITRLQHELDQLEQKAQRYAHQLFADA